MLIRTALAAFVVLVTATAVSAQSTPERVAVHGDWSVYNYSDASGPICYVATQPLDSEYSQAISSRDPAFFTISTRPGENIREEISIRTGYPLNETATVTATVDQEDAISLYIRTDVAADGVWVENPAIQSALVVAMKRGITLRVRGTSARGTVVTDTYSLRGITAALDRMATECPMPQ
jgi:invasion protein IalB